METVLAEKAYEALQVCFVSVQADTIGSFPSVTAAANRMTAFCTSAQQACSAPLLLNAVGFNVVHVFRLSVRAQSSESRPLARHWNISI